MLSLPLSLWAQNELWEENEFSSLPNHPPSLLGRWVAGGGGEVLKGKSGPSLASFNRDWQGEAIAWPLGLFTATCTRLLTPFLLCPLIIIPIHPEDPSGWWWCLKFICTEKVLMSWNPLSVIASSLHPPLPACSHYPREVFFDWWKVFFPQAQKSPLAQTLLMNMWKNKLLKQPHEEAAKEKQRNRSRWGS